LKGGYAGSILRVNLSTGVVLKEPTPEKVIRDFVGGRGFIAHTLYNEVPKGADPLGEESKLMIATGPLTGLFIPSTGKAFVGGKSPLTGGYAESNFGGHFPVELKMAGYDMIILEGKSPGPVYLLIDDDYVSIEDAGGLWGKGSYDTEKALAGQHGEDFQACVIGPAGENLVKIACISHDYGRQAGRTGLGAVMGSKNLKAVCVRGTRSIPIHDVKGLMEKGREMYRKSVMHPAFELWQTYGTSSVTNWSNRIGAFPTRNFRSGYFELFTNIAGPQMHKEVVLHSKACFSCAMCCGKYSHAKTDDYECYVEGPEYETTAMLGGNCALGSIKDIAYANFLCDDYGIDTISGGSIAGFAIECFEKGIITEKDTGGVNLAWGNPRGVFELLRMISYREHVGDILAEGTKAAALKLGKGSERFAIQMKGLEQSGYESRRAPAMQLSYMTADIGAHHRPSWAVTHDLRTGRETTEGKAEKVIELQHTRPLFDTLGVCRLPWIEMGIPVADYAEAFRRATGIDYSEEDLYKISERIWNLTRMFWVREFPDFGRAFDYPPARITEEPIESGPTKGAVLPQDKVDAMLDDYYSRRGWTEDGVPTPGKLRELGLDELVEKKG
jgi:aldehyde:ferredoxin oxidoreductase